MLFNSVKKPMQFNVVMADVLDGYAEKTMGVKMLKMFPEGKEKSPRRRRV
jgi:hypothetical protein